MDRKQEAIDYEKTANEYQHKFEMYLVALTFTIVGLAMQTAKFSANYWQSSAEVVAWALLIISGFVGLTRMRMLPTVFRTAAMELDRKQLLDDVTQNALESSAFSYEGKPLTKSEFTARLTAQAETYANSRRKLDKQVDWLTAPQTAFFFVGIVVIAGARAYAGMVLTC